MAISHRFAGVIAVVTLLPSLRWCPPPHPTITPGVFAGVPLALLPLLRWRLRHCFAGTVAVIASSPLLHWHCPLSCTRIAASIARALSPLLRWCCPRRTGVATSIALASLLTFHWCQHPDDAGFYAIVLLALLPSLPSLHWCRRPCRTRVLPASHGCLHRRSAGVVALIALMLPPPSHRRLHRQSAGVNTHVVLASKPSFCWRCCRHRVVAVIALTSSPSLHPQFASITLASLPLLSRCRWAAIFAIVLLALSP